MVSDWIEVVGDATRNVGLERSKVREVLESVCVSTSLPDMRMPSELMPRPKLDASPAPPPAAIPL